MRWTRLDPAGVIPQPRLVHDPASPDDEALAKKAATHLRDALLTGFIVVEDDLGHIFVGTEAAAVENMTAHSQW